MVRKNYKTQLYEDYADSFKNSAGHFDRSAAKKWSPCFKYYMRNWLPADMSSQIVDLGCGDGRLVFILDGMGYENVVGVDISESQLRLARQVSENIVQADVLKFLRGTSEKFDLILSFDVIEHLDKEDVLEFLDLCKSRLHSGGRLVLQTPNASSPFFGDVRYGDFTHEVAFTPKLLSQLLLRAGLQNVGSRETGPVPIGYSVMSTIRYLIWQIVRHLICFVEAVETGGCNQRVFARVFLITAQSSD